MDSQIISSIIISFSALVISWFYAARNSKREGDKMMKELFTEFNLRYDKLNDSLVLIEASYPEYEVFEKLKDDETTKKEFEKLKQAVIDYFNLCAEEFYWYYHKGRIDALVWKSWEKGMNYWFNEVPTVKKLWILEVKANGKESYYITDKKEFFVEKKL